MRKWDDLSVKSSLFIMGSQRLVSLFSRSVVFNSLWPHGLQHARPPCPSPTPGVYSNSCLFSQCYHPTISSSVIPFSSCLWSCPESGFFQMSQFFFQVDKMLEFQLQHQSFQWIFRTDFFRIDWLGLLAVQGTLKSLLQHHSSKASILLFVCLFSFFFFKFIYFNWRLIT